MTSSNEETRAEAWKVASRCNDLERVVVERCIALADEEIAAAVLAVSPAVTGGHDERLCNAMDDEYAQCHRLKDHAGQCCFMDLINRRATPPPPAVTGGWSCPYPMCSCELGAVPTCRGFRRAPGPPAVTGEDERRIEADVLERARQSLLDAMPKDPERYGAGLRFSAAVLQAMAYERRNHDWIESVRAAAPSQRDSQGARAERGQDD